MTVLTLPRGLARLLRMLGVSGIAALAGSGALAADCPLDRLDMVEKSTGEVLHIDKVAQDTTYQCEDADASAGTPFRDGVSNPGLGQMCRGPFGKTVFHAQFRGKTAFLVYEAIDASPCCHWYSLARLDAVAFPHLAWLPHPQVPRLDLVGGYAREWYRPGEPKPPWPDDDGPLRGKIFSVKGCRAE